MQLYTMPDNSRQASKGKSRRRISGTAAQKTNGFRLSDIAKLIRYRHGGACFDGQWHERYFFAALPHIIGSRILWQDAVRAWVREWTPVLFISRGADWIEDQARLCAEKRKRRYPTTDKLAKMLGVQVDEPEAAELCCIVAMSRPKKVRQAEDKERRRQAEQTRRALDPDHTPRTESFAAQARAQDITAGAERARRFRARKAAEKAVSESDAQQHVTTDAQQHVTDNSPRVTVSCPTLPLGSRNGFVPYISTNLNHGNHPQIPVLKPIALRPDGHALPSGL